MVHQGSKQVFTKDAIPIILTGVEYGSSVSIMPSALSLVVTSGMRERVGLRAGVFCTPPAAESGPLGLAHAGYEPPLSCD